jgi:glycosyltransferase involved in cell wall biosynthesis
MPALYQKVAIVCLPTRYREGIPVTLLEAAACAKPLVATDMPGCREIVRPGENGFLIRPGDVPGLAAALEKLIVDQELCRNFGFYSRKLVQAQFDSKRVIAETFVVYNELLGEKVFVL